VRLHTVARILALYPAAVALLLVALPIVQPRSGPFALLAIFAPHLALLALPLVAVAIARRGIALRGSLLVLALVSAVVFGDELLSVPPEQRPLGDRISTASWNLERGARSGNDAAGVLRTLDVDLVALQELGPEHAEAITSDPELASRFPAQALHPDPGVHGQGLLSRWPIVRSEIAADPAVLEVVVDRGDLRVTVINAHPLAGRLDLAGPIPVAFDAAGRDGRLRRIRDRIDAALGRGESVIVLGDFNVTPAEPGYRDLAEGLRDAHAEVGVGPGWTWRPSSFEWAGLGVIRIDLALSSPDVEPTSIIEDCGLAGDHCLVRATFAHSDGMFKAAFPAQGDIAPLPVTVIDRTGLVRSIEPMPGFDAPDGVSRHRDRADTLVVNWLGGMCDQGARVGLVSTGPIIRIAIQTDRQGACRLAGITRPLALQLDRAIDPSLVTVEEIP
jgi:endonuclease/exonuclease/phosphatase family metal-dependent hydrolase